MRRVFRILGTGFCALAALYAAAVFFRTQVWTEYEAGKLAGAALAAVAGAVMLRLGRSDDR